MSNPTSNFGWQMPASTDLVTDLPADFEVFGQAVDTSLADLKGGTTGQILSKNSNTDMDFVWSAAGMTNPMTTTGDTIYSSSGSTPARLGIGTSGQILTVSGGVPTWATPAGGGKVLQVVNATTATATTIASTTFTDTGLTATITPSSASSKILVLVTQISQSYNGTTSSYLGLKLLRGATQIWTTQTSGFGLDAAGSGATEINFKGVISPIYLDSPATTSATTYKTQGAILSTSNGGSAIFQSGNTISSITLLEIGA